MTQTSQTRSKSPKINWIGAFVLIALVAFGAGLTVADAGEAHHAEWLDFAGSLLGVGLTIGGGLFIIEWQASRESRSRTRLLLELLNDVDSECVPFQCANEPALKERYGRGVSDQIRRLRDSVERVHQFREKLMPETAQMMRVSDKLKDLSFDAVEIEGWLQSIRFYPASADLGGFNAMGHQIQGTVDEARKMLR